MNVRACICEMSSDPRRARLAYHYQKMRERDDVREISGRGAGLYVCVSECVAARACAGGSSPHSCTRVLHGAGRPYLSSLICIPEITHARVCVLYIIFIYIYICKLSMAPLESSRMPSRIYAYYYANCRAHSLSDTHTT